MSQYSRPIRLRAFLCIGLLVFGLRIISKCQENRSAPQNGVEQTQKPEKDCKIRVGVEEVRLDAVVVDKKGHQITDLTTDDFEIYQDGQPQKIISSTYISDYREQPRKNAVSTQDSKKIPPIPAPALTRDEVHRTIVFLVDDISMNFQDLSNARMALQKFVETQMQPGDLVAIMQTKGWNAGLQTFSSDKRQLLARINRLRWSTLRRPDSYPMGLPQIPSIGYSLRSLQDMPGRKFLLLISTQIMMPGSDESAFNGLADAALRAGVVIHSMDILGVFNDSTVQQLTIDPKTGQIIPDGVGLLDAETKVFKDTTEHKLDKLFGPTDGQIKLGQSQSRMKDRPLPLSQKTGGLFLTGQNFFLKGIGDAVEEEMRGYYLLSYIPPANTFEQDKQMAYHKLKVKVKRPGATVRTRDGFLGAPDTFREPAEDQNPLMKAVFSPFRYNDLSLDLASGYVEDPPNGYLLRAWLHLDGRQVGFINEKDGSRSISLEAVAVTSDINSLIQDSGNVRIGFHVNNKDIRWIRENSVAFSLFFPTKKPGAYFVRAAVKDQASGAIGSAYQFVEIPDLKKDGLSLSSIFVVNQDEDSSWIQSRVIDNSRGQAAFSRQVARRSQAFRSYLPGESLDYMTVIYNAKGKEGLKPDLESQYVLFQNGNEIFRSKPETVNTDEVKDFRRITIKKRLKLEKAMQPGDYVLQLQVRDKQAKAKHSLVAQTLDFKIVSKTSEAAISQILVQQETSVFAKRKSVVEMTAKELRKLYGTQLNYLKFSENQDQLDILLKQAGDRVIAFFRDFSNVASKERVHMVRTYNTLAKMPVLIGGLQHADLLELDHRTISMAESRDDDYQYLILPGSKTSGTSWIEDRTKKNNQPVNQKDLQGYYISSGYAGYCLYLHPAHQVNSYFRYLGRETRKPAAHIIAFVQKPEAGDYLSKFSEEDSSTPIRYLVQGLVWLDPHSFQILRMSTSLLLPEKRTWLKNTNTDISYEKVQFEKRGQEFWLPQVINVSWQFMRADGTTSNYYNQHKYSDYHLFIVNTDYEINKPKVNK
jgi:VWFA-related protein